MISKNSLALTQEQAGSPGNRSFESLLSAGFHSGFLDEACLSAIQADISAILQQLILKYTFGQGNSVKEQTAVQILSSIRYALDCYACSFGSVRAFCDSLRENTTESFYMQGVQIVKKLVSECEHLSDLLKSTSPALISAPYRDIIYTALPSFFAQYDTEFFANETACSIDYPLALPAIPYTGVRFIKEYIRRFAIETDFIRCFELAKVNAMIVSHAGKYRLEPEESPFNIFEVVLDAALLCGMCGVVFPERVTEQQLEQLQEKISLFSDSGLKWLLTDEARALINSLGIQQRALMSYIDEYLKNNYTKFCHAVRTKSLFWLANTQSSPSKANTSLIGERLNDFRFSFLLEQIGACTETPEKISLILSEIHAKEDMIDLLESDCLDEEEYAALFFTLDKTAFALLGAEAINDEFFDKPDLSLEELAILSQNASHEWVRYYFDALCKMPEYDDIANAIACLSNNIG